MIEKLQDNFQCDILKDITLLLCQKHFNGVIKVFVLSQPPSLSSGILLFRHMSSWGLMIQVESVRHEGSFRSQFLALVVDVMQLHRFEKTYPGFRSYGLDYESRFARELNWTLNLVMKGCGLCSLSPVPGVWQI